MKFKVFSLFILLTLMALSSSSLAQVKITDGVYIDAYFRPRLEIDGRDFSNKTGFDAYSTFRSRVGLSLENLIENTKLYLQIADSRSMGFSDPYLNGQPIGPNKLDMNLGVIMAYIELRELFSPGIWLKIGRMDNNQGRNRLFGPGNWQYTGPRVYDGLKIGYESKDFSLHLWNFFGANGDRHWYYDQDSRGDYPDEDYNYKLDHTLTGVDASFMSGKVNLLTFLDLDQNPVENLVSGETNIAFSRFTLAGYFKHIPLEGRGLSWDMDIAYQFGNLAYSAGNGDISAYMAAGDIAWHFGDSMKKRIGLGFDIVSGDDGMDDAEINNFYELYYSKHGFQGHMDYFRSVSGVKSRGLRDLILRAGIAPLPNLKCSIDLHKFITEKAFASKIDSGNAYDLGWELDTTFDYLVRKGVEARLGLDFFFPSEDWQGEDADIGIFIYTALSAEL